MEGLTPEQREVRRQQVIEALLEVLQGSSSASTPPSSSSSLSGEDITLSQNFRHTLADYIERTEADIRALNNRVTILERLLASST